MKKFSSVLYVVTLFVATGCGGTTPDNEEMVAPSTVQSSEEVVQTVAKKPIAGEAEHTFSLSIPFEPVTLAQGEEKAVQIGINRGENFGEEVEIEVSGLPQGVTMETKEPVITKSSTGVTLQLNAAADAALGDFTAKVTGHTASSGADFTSEIKVVVTQK